MEGGGGSLYSSSTKPRRLLTSDMHSTTCCHHTLQMYQEDAAVPLMLGSFWTRNSVSPFCLWFLHITFIFQVLVLQLRTAIILMFVFFSSC